MKKNNELYCNNCGIQLTAGDEVEVQFESYTLDGKIHDLCFNCVEKLDNQYINEGWHYEGGFGEGDTI